MLLHISVTKCVLKYFMQSTCSTKCLQPSLFPSASLCVAAPSVPSLLFNFLRVSELCVCVRAHAPAHTNTHILTTSRRGGSLELATITVCIVAYSLCLTGHTPSALLLFLCTASYIIPFTSANTYPQSVWGGAVSTHAGLQKTFTVSPFAFCSLHLLC